MPRLHQLDPAEPAQDARHLARLEAGALGDRRSEVRPSTTVSTRCSLAASSSWRSLAEKPGARS